MPLHTGTDEPQGFSQLEKLDRWTRSPRFLPAPGSRSPRPGPASAGPPRLAPRTGAAGPAALLPRPGRRVCAPRAPWTGVLQGTRRCLTRRGPRPHEKRSCLSTAMAGLPRSGRKCAREGRRVREPQVGGTGLAREDPPGRLGLPAPPGSEPRPLQRVFVLQLPLFSRLLLLFE